MLNYAGRFLLPKACSCVLSTEKHSPEQSLTKYGCVYAYVHVCIDVHVHVHAQYSRRKKKNLQYIICKKENKSVLPETLCPCIL